MRSYLAFFFVILFSLLCHPAIAAEKKIFPITPNTNNGAKWRVGYYEGGPYKNYPMVLKSIVKGLITQGWIEPVRIPFFQDKDNTSKMWEFLSYKIKSDYITFVEEAYWSSNWDEKQRETNKKNAIQRLFYGMFSEEKKIDLMIAMGTWAGKDLANNSHCVPTLVVSSSDPIGSGIVKSVKESGFNHIHARIDSSRYERQIRLFHDIIHFNTLGLAYENSDAGKSYAGLKQIQKVAVERGFQIVNCFTKDEVPDQKEADDSMLRCAQELSKTADAVYLTLQRGVNADNLPRILEPLNQNKIPTFSQSGSAEVKAGVLLSIAQAEFKYAGLFHAKNMAKIFNGANPGDLNQVFEDPAKIALNLITAQMVEYDPPVNILGAADEIWLEIKTPDTK